MGLLAKKYGLKWGRIRGFLKLTPEQALANFGFSMKPTATGVNFRVYKYTTSGGKTRKGTFINNHVPPTITHTASQQQVRDRFKVIRNIANNYHTDIITTIWKPEAKRKGRIPCIAFAEFMKQNLLAVDLPADYEKMLISVGPAEPTNEITSINYNPGTRTLTVHFNAKIYGTGNGSDLTGLFVYSIPINESTHYAPDTAQRKQGYITVTIPAGLWIRPLLLFIYFHNSPECLYSPSTAYKLLPI